MSSKTPASLPERRVDIVIIITHESIILGGDSVALCCEGCPRPAPTDSLSLRVCILAWNVANRWWPNCYCCSQRWAAIILWYSVLFGGKCERSCGCKLQLVLHVIDGATSTAARRGHEKEVHRSVESFPARRRPLPSIVLHPSFQEVRRVSITKSLFVAILVYQSVGSADWNYCFNWRRNCDSPGVFFG